VLELQILSNLNYSRIEGVSTLLLRHPHFENISKKYSANGHAEDRFNSHCLKEAWMLRITPDSLYLKYKKYKQNSQIFMN
jgi:hypothetical protein